MGAFPITYASQAGYAVVSFTRPADTAIYADKDAVGSATGSTAAMEFTQMGQNGGSIVITSGSLEIRRNAVISGESYYLELYGVAPPSAYGDNAAWGLAGADIPYHLGSINFGVPVVKGSTVKIELDSINKQLRLVGTSLFAYLVTASYTPASATVHVIKLHTLPV